MEKYSTPELIILEIVPETASCTSMGGASEKYGIEEYDWK